MTTSAQPSALVSVVIPTRDRPLMVRAAVQSALAQTLPPLEVIVVIDGAELDAGSAEAAGTFAVLSALSDARVRVLALPASVGGAEARNTGVREANGDWIAFLDDDDLWMPHKLAEQLASTENCPASVEPVVSCAVIARSPKGDEVWPRERYRAGQDMAEYLFCRRGWRYGEALLQTSTLILRRRLMLQVPFTPGLRKHQDWDWLLRVASRPEVRIWHAGVAPLVVFHIEGERSSVGRTRDWRFSVQWAHENRERFTRRAMSAFLATECAPQLEGEGLQQRLAFLTVLLPAQIVSPTNAMLAAAFVLVPQRFRRSMRNSIKARLNQIQWLRRLPAGKQGMAPCWHQNAQRTKPPSRTQQPPA